MFCLMLINRKEQRLSRREFGVAASVLSAAWCAGAADGAVMKAGAEGFSPLFDGKSLEGWHTNTLKSIHGPGGRWVVEDGVLLCEQEPPGSGNGGLLLSDRRFGDFELLVDMRPDWGPDSGIFFRCTEAGAGYQAYVDYHDAGNVGHLRGELPGAFAMKPFQIFADRDTSGRITGFTTKPDSRATKWPDGVYAYSCPPEAWIAAWRVHDWNTMRIRCAGVHPEITTWINGVKICTFSGDACALPGYNKERVLKTLGREGMIGLQVHGGLGSWPKGTRCRWKNILIKEL